MTTVFAISHCNINRLLTRSLLLGTLSIAGILLGVVPAVQPASGFSWSGLELNFNHAAYAQAVTDEEIIDYARSVLAIEPLRQDAYEQIKQITGSANVPSIACHRPSSLNELPGNVREIAVSYCNQAIAIVESNNLTISRFNAITVAHQSDSALSDRIQQAILRLQ
ncbi:MAG: hypothetical protein Kow00121_31020 [Elainellaceae cyanobacterium]